MSGDRAGGCAASTSRLLGLDKAYQHDLRQGDVEVSELQPGQPIIVTALFECDRAPVAGDDLVTSTLISILEPDGRRTQISFQSQPSAVQ